MPQAGLDLWEVRSNRTKMRGTALTALEPLVFTRISTEIGLALAPAVDGMLGQPVTTGRGSGVWWLCGDGAGRGGGRGGVLPLSQS